MGCPGPDNNTAVTSPLLLDLLRFADEAGFERTHFELLVDVEPGTWAVDWNRLLDMSPNPNALTVRESLVGALTPDEFVRFERHIQPLADSGRGIRRSAFAYLHATMAGSEDVQR
jgi:hypothetical protein